MNQFEVILMIGDKLKEYFPYQSNDVERQTISAMVTQMRKFILTIFYISVSVLLLAVPLTFYPANQQEW